MTHEKWVPDFEFDYELQKVMQSASDKLLGEQQLDTDAEILENIRFEMSQVSWLDRLPPKGSHMHVTTSHPECESVSGLLILANSTVLVLEDEFNQHVVLNSHIVSVCGLLPKTRGRPKQVLDPFALRLILSQFAEQKISATWLLSGGKVISGILHGLFSDSLLVVAGAIEHTIIQNHLVAIRAPK